MSQDEFREKWRRAEGAHERLRWARMYWQVRSQGGPGSAQDAAESLGIKAGTYRGYERAPTSSKTISFDAQQAIFFARKFNVDWHWLLLGTGTPFDGQLTDSQARVIDVMAKVDPEAQATLAAMVEAFFQTRRAG